MAHYRKDCITLLMTTRCNLACSYCYLKNCALDGESINVEFAQRGIEDYFLKSQSRHIRFFGAGEPTLEFEKVQALRDYAHHLAGSALKTEIQTNGVFPVSTAKWLARNANIVWISCDGVPEVQDKLRPIRGSGKSSKVIERNVAVLLNEGVDITVGFRSTIAPQNLYRQIEMIEYFTSLGVTAIFSDPMFPPVEVHNTHVKKWNMDDDFLIIYAREFLIARKRAEELGCFYSSVLVVNFDEKTEYACRACIPSPHLTTDGYVTSCDMAFLGGTLPELVYGRFDSITKKIIYDFGKIRAIQMRNAANLIECQGCELLFHCVGGCVGEAVNETGRLLGVKKDYCEAMKYLAHRMPVNAGSYPYLHP